MKVSDYLPKLYNKNIEMTNIINSEEQELETNLKPGIDSSFKNTFAKAADSNGISNFEEMLGIQSDKSTESLSFRRSRILERLASHIPFTLEYLKSKLDNIFGTDGYTLVYDFENNMTLNITSTSPGDLWWNEAITLMESVVPCNIQWSIQTYAATWQLIMNDFNTWQDIYDADYTWQYLLDNIQ